MANFKETLSQKLVCCLKLTFRYKRLNCVLLKEVNNKPLTLFLIAQLNDPQDTQLNDPRDLFGFIPSYSAKLCINY